MFKNLKVFLGKDNYNIIFFILFISCLSALIEIVVINTLALFVTMLVDTSLFLNNIPIDSIKNYLIDLDDKDLIYRISYFILVIVLIKSIFITLTNYFEISFFSNIKLKNSHFLFSYYITRNYDYYLNKYLPEMLSNSFHDMERAHTFLIQLFACLREIILGILIFYLLITKSLMITSICFFIFTFLGLIYFFLIKNLMEQKSKQISFFQSKVFNILTNALEDIKFIKVINCEKTYIENHKSYLSKTINAEKNSIFYSRLPRTILELFGILAFILSIFYFLSIDTKTSSIISELSIFGFAILRLIPIFSIIVSNLTNLKYFNHSFSKISNELKNYKDDLTLQKSQKNYDQFINEKIEDVTSIQLKNINFKYKTSSDLILKDVSVNFKNKSITGIVGPSGSGKSTLIGVLLGLLKPDTGEIIFNFKNGKTKTNIKNNFFGYVPQNIFLIDDTVRRNVALGMPDEKIDNQKVIRCLKNANIYDQFANSKDKLNSRLGYRGLNLSGGQIQRIGIARALYFEPKIIILDESTNALDKTAEKIILNEITNLKKIMGFVIISHKESTMSVCDEIFSINNGQII
tara:strand:+ start:3930 stop:5660 length:1731 start_codon:yes stop_codon:yes gene_type:complete